MRLAAGDPRPRWKRSCECKSHNLPRFDDESQKYPCAAFREGYLMETRPTIGFVIWVIYVGGYWPQSSSAVTNARFSSLHGLTVGPVSLSTTPVPLRKPRARHERAFARRRKRGGLPSAVRRRAVPLRLRFARRSSPPSAPLSPLTDRRPKPPPEPSFWRTGNTPILSHSLLAFCCQLDPW